MAVGTDLSHEHRNKNITHLKERQLQRELMVTPAPQTAPYIE